MDRTDTADRRLAAAWPHLTAADRDEVAYLAEDLAADQPSWWANRGARDRT